MRGNGASENLELNNQLTPLHALCLRYRCRHGLSTLHAHARPRLIGFMTEQEYLSCLHYQMISKDGGVIPMPVPIVLPVADDTKAKLEGKSSIALKKPSGEVAASRMSSNCGERASTK